MGPSRRRLVLLVFAAGWLSAAQVGKVPPALSMLRQEFGLSMVEAGWLASLIACVAAMLGVLGGMSASVVGFGRSLVAGLLMIGVGSLMAALATDANGLLVARLFEAFGFVMVVVTAPSLLAIILDDEPLWRQRGLIVWGTYMPVGVAAMMLLAPLLLAYTGWRSLWMLNALLCAFLIVLVARCWRPLTSLADRGTFNVRLLRDGLRLPGPYLMGLSFGCYSAIWFILVTWLPTFAVSDMGYSPSSAAWLTAAAVLLNVVGNLSAQLFAAAGVPRWLVLVGVQLLIGSVGWMVFSPGFSDLARAWAAVLACGLAGALPASVFSGIPLHARQPEQIGVGNGILMQLGSLGTFAGPPAIAFAVTHLGGWYAGRWLIPVLAVVGLLAALILRGVERRIERQSRPITTI